MQFKRNRSCKVSARDNHVVHRKRAQQDYYQRIIYQVQILYQQVRRNQAAAKIHGEYEYTHEHIAADQVLARQRKRRHSSHQHVYDSAGSVCLLYTSITPASTPAA